MVDLGAYSAPDHHEARINQDLLAVGRLMTHSRTRKPLVPMVRPSNGRICLNSAAMAPSSRQCS